MAGQKNSWLLLIGEQGLTTDQEELLKGVKGKVKEIHIFGGPGVVPVSTVERIKVILDL